MLLPGVSWRVMRIFGIPVEINITWIIIFGLVAIILTNNFFPLVFPGQSSSAYLFLGVLTTVMFFASLIAHELSHSIVAINNGIGIRKITLFIFGGISELTAEPAEPRIELKMALAGPAMSLAIAIVLGIMAAVLNSVGANRLIVMPLIYLAQINGFLAVFNMLPGFPLDGGRVLRAIIWGATKSIHRATAIAARGGELLAMIFLLLGLFLLTQGQLGNGLWIMLLGWFLGQAAVQSFEQSKITESLENIRVSQIMTKDVQHVPAELSLDKLVADYFLKYRFGRFPVERAGHIIGIVTIRDVGKVPPEQWSLLMTDSISRPIEEETRVSPEIPALKAMDMLARGVPHLLVYNNTDLVGIVTRNDILKLMEIRGKLGI